MILQSFALKKGKDVAGHNIQSLAKCGKRFGIEQDRKRNYTSGKPLESQEREELAKENCEQLSNQHEAKKKAKALDRDFFLSVLGSSATKREAKSYIQRFTPPKTTPPKQPKPPKQEAIKQAQEGNGINLGGIYAATRAVAESPKFVQQPEQLATTEVEPPMHLALVKLRAPQTLDDATLNGIGRTLSQLGRLGLMSVVVVDCDNEDGGDPERPGPEWRHMVNQQAIRIVAAIDSSGKTEARLVDNTIGVAEEVPNFKNHAYLKGKIHVTLRNFLMTPLRRGVVPVISPIGYMDATQRAIPLKASDIILALTREFAGFQSSPSPEECPVAVKERFQALRKEVSLDRIIVLDPLGGIPTSDRKNGYHVFLNMEQEYELTRTDLCKTGGVYLGNLRPETTEGTQSKIYREGDPKANSLPSTRFHLDNLDLVRKALYMLPPSSSALLTTPDEAANTKRQPEFIAAGVGTRRQRNPLIHNLLTDKPVFSSSLPIGRLGQSDMDESVSSSRHLTPTTFAKHGMPVTIFPDPKITSWQPPIAGNPQISLTDSQIDLSRLVNLIEDSFNKKLDVQDYLKRVNNRIAGVIIAGEYEGGALLTWELPPGVPDDGSEESRRRMVPYLDKFAVLKRSQGSGGVADVVFKTMVRQCFPNGVCWRSRKDNPVNKWYFERSRTTLKLPGTNWTMFFTTPEQNMDHQTFKDYEAVCKTIEPSWADKTVPQD